jgi:hypothetical protein
LLAGSLGEPSVRWNGANDPRAGASARTGRL